MSAMGLQSVRKLEKGRRLPRMSRRSAPTGGLDVPPVYGELATLALALVFATCPSLFGTVSRFFLLRSFIDMPAARRPCLVFVLLVLVPLSVHAQDEGGLHSPASFLGYELGEQFTPHHRIVDYVQHVAARSPAVTLQHYGTSHEGRPLLLATITTPDNHNRLETIRRSNLQRAGRIDGTPQTDEAIVWLSYGVHGDEASSPEAAMKTLHALADTSTARTQGWLEDTVVLLDPALNPDGRQRYVQWFRQTVGATANPHPSAREHHPPWAPGRTNHYYFDLNRDWAWAVQHETRERLDVYHRWMPNVHVDYHEMGADDPYYFAPGAEPFHEDLTEWQRDFQFTIGRNNASYFDRNGWLYFTREVFDLFYPGYGDTWPLFNGAIGMTYEQGGGGAAGRAVRTSDGDTLTLAERIAHHHTTGLSTVETAARHHSRLTAEFATYYQTAQETPPGEYQTYVVRRDGQEDRVDALAEHLDRQRIRYGYAAEEIEAEGRSYGSGRTESLQIQPGDLIVDAAQPKARLVKVLLEPETAIVDSLTYDVTAWGLPYAYGVEAYALSERTEPDTVGTPPSQPELTGTTDEPYAYVTPWRSRADARFVGALLQEDVRLRFATKEFTIDDRTYEPGTLLITRTGNADRLDRFDETVQQIAQAHDQPLHAVETGFTDDGPDFGSSNIGFVEEPRVAVLSGAPLSSTGVGEVWHFFDQQLSYPATLLPAEDFEVGMLDDVDVLVLPDGEYEEWLSDPRAEGLTRWVRQGGRLIALGDANAALADRSVYRLTQKPTETAVDTVAEASLEPYGSQSSLSTPGSIHRVEIDPSHPLAFGLEAPYFTLKRSADAYAFSGGGTAAGVLEAGAPVSGFMGARAQGQIDDTLVFGTQRMGEGEVVYFVDNPLFRGFWYGGHVLFSNAVFFVGNR
jgi:hypothetical protein